MARAATIDRTTRETSIQLTLDIDGQGRAEIDTGAGFLDHMLALFAGHGLMDLTVSAQGDLQVDAHHTTEDVGICLGTALSQALGDRAGIQRYGHAVLPMDEALVTSAVDLGGRPWLHFDVRFPSPQVGSFDTELVAEFWRAVANHAACSIHVILAHGGNSHHISEAVFKSLARSLRDACARDPRRQGIPSTKGQLTQG